MKQDHCNSTDITAMHRHRGAAVILLLTVWAHLPCQTVRGSFTENFDSTAAGSLPVGWQAAGFGISTTSPHSAPNCIAATGNMTEKWCVTPALDLSGRFPLRLSFYERRSSTAAHYRLEVCASLDGRRDPIVLAQFDSIGSSTTYVARSVSLEGYGLEDQPGVRIRWRIRPDSTNSTGVLRVDDIAITCAASADLAVRSLEVSPPTPDRTTPVHVCVQVENLGRILAQDFSIALFEDRNADAILEERELLSTVMAAALSAGDSLLVECSLPPFPPGPHRVYAHARWSADEEPSNDTLSRVVNVGHARGDVAITEIMYAPQGDEPEWIEAFNMSPDTIDLRGWRISDSNTSSRALIANASPVPPGAYLILARDATFTAIHPDPFLAVRTVTFSALNNTTPDAVVLFDPAGAVVDSVRYEPSWGGQAGRSLERIDEFSPRCDAANWSGCIDPAGSTPGRLNSIARLPYDLLLSRIGFERKSADSLRVWGIIRNAGRQAAPEYAISLNVVNADDTTGTPPVTQRQSVAEPLLPLDSAEVDFVLDSVAAGRSICTMVVEFDPDERHRNDTLRLDLLESYTAGDLIVNEIMFDPLPDQTEWIEIVNRTRRPVSVDGWSISDAPTASGSVNQTRISVGAVLTAGGFIVVAADSTLFDAFPALRTLPARCAVLNLASGLGLNNDGDVVVLQDPSGRTIDSVRYEARWHHPSLPDPRGHSLERISPEFASNDPRSWSSCTSAGGGSPGERNSIAAQPSPASGTISISPNPFSPDGDGFEDFCGIRYHLPFESCVMNIRIFDLRGRLVRWLANTEFTGADGIVIWDGLSDARQRVRLGGYVLLLQAVRHPDGAEFSARALIAVATRF